ncbi:MAG: site-2 protease family protein [Candidatus Anstonellaceae archaeon]
MQKLQWKKLLFSLLLTVAGIFAFWLILFSPFSAFAKFIFSIIVLSLSGLAFSKAFELEGLWGLILLRSKWGLREIELLARRHPKLWQYIAEVGTVVSYGSFAHFLLGKKETNLKHFIIVYGIGTFFMVTFATLIAPLAVTSLLSMLSGAEEFNAAKAKMSETVGQFEYSRQIFFILLVFGGIALTTTASIVAYGLGVAWAIISAILGNHAVLASTAPGGSPIIPGINLPLLEGLAALLVVLIAHEGFHGILARRHKIPVKSAGVALFGFVPIGAFVDVDEKRLFLQNREHQNSVLVAGISANFLASLAFLLLLLAAANVTEPLRVSGIYVEKSTGGIPEGALIQEINGRPVQTLLGLKLKPETVYTIKTNVGVFKKKTDEKGDLGIAYVKADKSGKTGTIRYAKEFSWISAVMRFFILAFALNFIVGAMNLVPLPLFDGYHIMRTAIKDKFWRKAIVYLVVGAFLLNLFPWVLR